MSYSLDFRKRVLELKDREGLSNKETSKRFGVSMRSLFRWQNRIEPKLKRDKPATKIDMHQLALDVEEYPDAYLEERAERLGVSASGIFYALRRLEITNKKNTKSP